MKPHDVDVDRGEACVYWDIGRRLWIASGILFDGSPGGFTDYEIELPSDTRGYEQAMERGQMYINDYLKNDLPVRYAKQFQAYADYLKREQRLKNQSED